MSGAEPRRDGNLREALIEAAMTLIAERGVAGFAIAELARMVGVSPAAPYRHFRSRDAVLAEVARRGFEQLADEIAAARRGVAGPLEAIERCAAAHFAFAAREAPVYAAMSEPLPPGEHQPALAAARARAFGELREAARDAVSRVAGAGRPPAQMVALHVWSLTHGIALLYGGRGREGLLPMRPEELLEAGVMLYLRGLGIS
jgi:AcrR family transcriptional regulator